MISRPAHSVTIASTPSTSLVDGARAAFAAVRVADPSCVRRVRTTA